MVAHVLASLLFLAVTQIEIAHDPAVRNALWEMLADAQYGFAATEEAMFIVRDDNGDLSFVRWEPARTRHQAAWLAPMPDNVVAIAHTHPNQTPQPSLIDMRTSVRNNIPVYVVTLNRITKTSEGETTTVASGKWNREELHYGAP